MIKSEAVFDCLYIGSFFKKKLGDFSSYELQLFSYLACLLRLYDGFPISSWGYSYIKNELGSPYSREIDDAISALSSRQAFITTEDSFIKITPEGESDLRLFSTFHSNQSRILYLNAACQSTKILNYGLVKRSIINEPIIHSANQQSGKRLLTDENNAAFSVLYDQFEMLRTALERNYKSPLIPAVIWLEFLNQRQELFTSYDLH